MTDNSRGRLDLITAVAVIRDEEDAAQREADERLASAKSLVAGLQRGLEHQSFAGKFSVVPHMNYGSFIVRDHKRDEIFEVVPTYEGTVEIKRYNGGLFQTADHNEAMREIATILIDRRIL